jgi:phosphatidylinositol alpha-1,6-mannosyltransferase
MVTAALAPLLRLRQTSRDVAFVAIAHGRDVTLPFHPYQLWLRRALPRLNAVIAVSEATRDECVRRGAAEERVHVIPNGVAPERFSSMVPRAVARRLVEELVASRGLTIPQESVLLASVGRHVIRKGFGWFVGEVMPLLPDRYVYLLAGDGPQSRLIKKQVVHRSLESRVHLLGKLSDDALKTLYRGSDLFILPNIPVAGDLEGFGVVMLEAGMSGTPVIAAHVDGVPSVICEGENGVLVASGDAGAFAEAIECSVNGRGALNIRNRAEGYIRESFAWPVIVERYVALLQAVSTAFRAG